MENKFSSLINFQMNCKSSGVLFFVSPFRFFFFLLFFFWEKLNYENVKNNIHVCASHPYTRTYIYKRINAKNNLHKNICAKKFSTHERAKDRGVFRFPFSENFHMKSKCVVRKKGGQVYQLKHRLIKNSGSRNADRTIYSFSPPIYP